MARTQPGVNDARRPVATSDYTGALGGSGFNYSNWAGSNVKPKTSNKPKEQEGSGNVFRDTFNSLDKGAILKDIGKDLTGAQSYQDRDTWLPDFIDKNAPDEVVAAASGMGAIGNLLGVGAAGRLVQWAGSQITKNPFDPESTNRASGLIPNPYASDPSGSYSNDWDNNWDNAFMPTTDVVGLVPFLGKGGKVAKEAIDEAKAVAAEAAKKAELRAARARVKEAWGPVKDTAQITPDKTKLPELGSSSKKKTAVGVAASQAVAPAYGMIDDLAPATKKTITSVVEAQRPITADSTITIDTAKLTPVKPIKPSYTPPKQAQAADNAMSVKEAGEAAGINAVTPDVEPMSVEQVVKENQQVAAPTQVTQSQPMGSSSSGAQPEKPTSPKPAPKPKKNTDFDLEIPSISASEQVKIPYVY